MNAGKGLKRRTSRVLLLKVVPGLATSVIPWDLLEKQQPGCVLGLLKLHFVKQAIRVHYIIFEKLVTIREKVEV